MTDAALRALSRVLIMVACIWALVLIRGEEVE